MSEFKDAFDAINNTQDTTASYSREDIEKNKFMAILAYFSWLVLIPLFCAKESKFARFHVNQGLVLAIAELLINVVFWPLRHIWLIGWIFGIIYALVGICAFILFILGVVNAANGRAKELPIIGGIHLIS